VAAKKTATLFYYPLKHETRRLLFTCLKAPLFMCLKGVLPKTVFSIEFSFLVTFVALDRFGSLIT
jgi:hypothetical protein